MPIPIKHLVLPCTNRKASGTGTPIRYAGMSDPSVEAWRRTLEAVPSALRFPAHRVYVGGSWTRAWRARLQVPQAACWIASAGYGLIRDIAPIAPYQATFQANTPDTVARDNDSGNRSDAMRAWFEALSPDWDADLGRHRGITLCQLSLSYVDAMLPGLQRLARRLGERLVILCPGAASDPGHPLRAHLLPIDARIEAELQTTRSDLGAAALEWLFRRHPPASGWDLTRLRRDLRAHAKRLPALRVIDRRRLDDEEVFAFLDEEAPKLSRPSASSLLRILRDSGRACEQKRFRDLFRRWRATHEPQESVA